MAKAASANRQLLPTSVPPCRLPGTRLQIGCDPKSDSTVTLRGGEYFLPFLIPCEKRRMPKPDDLVFSGFNGVFCVEAGGPAPGVGCAGRGIITAVELLKQQRVFESLDLDYVIYDVLGDVVCGGFAVPIREGSPSMFLPYHHRISWLSTLPTTSLPALRSIRTAVEHYWEV